MLKEPLTADDSEFHQPPQNSRMNSSTIRKSVQDIKSTSSSGKVANWCINTSASLLFLPWILVGGILALILQFMNLIFRVIGGIFNLSLMWFLQVIYSPDQYRDYIDKTKNSAVYWKWQSIDTRQVAFPENFLWGTATAAHQVEGGCSNNNWADFERRDNALGKPAVKHGDKCGLACDHWNRMEEDLGLMQKLGCNSYRFSLEWSKIQPAPDQWNQDAIDHYHQELDILLRNNIIPMVTLHHFTHPIWFEEMGGFEKKQNIDYFLAFVARMYDEYGSKVSLWSTFNEPAVFVSNGWINGIFPPGKRNKFILAAEVMLNILRAHVVCYEQLKEQAELAKQTVEIGIVKDIFQFDPHTWWNPLDQFIAWQLSQNFNAAVLDFFRSGVYNYWIPFVCHRRYTDKKAIHSNDFVGLNYYSHFTVSLWNLITNPVLEEKLSSHQNEIHTDMPHVMYPEGFYRALREMGTLGHPVYVTENGIADGDDSRRHLYLRRYIYAMSKAIEDGVDVRGYFYWTLMDNFEWSEGYQPKFGLYSVNFDTQERKLRDGSKYLVDVITQYRDGGLRSRSTGPGNTAGEDLA